MELDTSEVEAGVEVDETFSPVKDDNHCVLTEPIRPSTCGLGASLDGSLVGLGAWRISSYKVKY